MQPPIPRPLPAQLYPSGPYRRWSAFRRKPPAVRRQFPIISAHEPFPHFGAVGGSRAWADHTPPLAYELGAGCPLTTAVRCPRGTAAPTAFTAGPARIISYLSNRPIVVGRGRPGAAAILFFSPAPRLWPRPIFGCKLNPASRRGFFASPTDPILGTVVNRCGPAGQMRRTFP